MAGWLRGRRHGGLSREFADFLVTVLSMSKIHVLAVHPNQHGRGYGQRLLRDAVHIGRSDGLNMLYGLFQSDRPQLRRFCQSGGFEVLDPGEPLALYAATGNTDDAMVPEPNESVVAHSLGKSRPSRMSASVSPR